MPRKKRFKPTRATTIFTNKSTGGTPLVAIRQLEHAYRMAAPGVTDKQIAEEVGVARTTVEMRAKKGGWVKGDLYKDVQTEVEKNLILDAERSTDEAVKFAGQQATDVVRDHRFILKRLRDAACGLLSELTADLPQSCEQADGEFLDIGEDGRPGEFRPSKKKPMSLNTKAKSLEAIARAMAQCVILERKSWNLDADNSGDSMAMEIKGMKDGDIDARIAILLSRTGIAGPAGREGAAAPREQACELPSLPEAEAVSFPGGD